MQTEKRTHKNLKDSTNINQLNEFKNDSKLIQDKITNFNKLSENELLRKKMRKSKSCDKLTLN